MIKIDEWFIKVRSLTQIQVWLSLSQMDSASAWFENEKINKKNEPTHRIDSLS
jgi:hypothetical protein